MKTINKLFTYAALISSMILLQNCALLKAAEEQGVSLNDSNFNPFALPNEYVFPRSFFGASAGIGFENDFDESSICIGAEYLHRFSNQDKKTGFYAGVTANYENISFDDYKWNVFKTGLKGEWLLPITRSRETSLILGGKVTYDFGSQESNGFKDNISGYQASLFSCVNVRYNESLSFGLEFNVLSHLNYTLKADDSDFESDLEDTQLLLNSHNPGMLYVRWSPKLKSN